MNNALQPQRSNPLLEIRDLVIESRGPSGWRPIVDKVSLSVRRGEILGLIGESGAGKSTVGLAALGYVRRGCRIASGSVIFDEQDITALGERHRRRLRGARIAYVAQSAAAALNPRRRLLDQCIEVPVRTGVDPCVAAERARDMFRQLNLPEPDTIGQRYPHELSGGQLQRVMIAMAMLPEPDLVVFDEPTTALDVTTQVQVLLAARDLVARAGSAALYISHDLAVVMQLADQMMVLRHGRMVEHGPTERLATAPETPYARALLNVEHFQPLSAGVRQAAALLEVDRVDAAYGQRLVLSEVSLTVPAGQTVAIVGESGSGKSTLARVVTGILPPITGSIRWNGQPLSPTLMGRSLEQARRMQLIHQSPDTALNPKQLVRDVIGRPLQRFGKYPRIERQRRTEELLQLVELDPAQFLDRRTTELSGGQKQRLCIARALAAEPTLLICDEVTSALDPLVADGILRLLNRLQAELGLSCLFITHDLAIVRGLSTSVVVMQTGKVVESGPTAEIFQPPCAPYTEQLIRATPEKRIGWLDEHIAASGEASRRETLSSSVNATA